MKPGERWLRAIESSDDPAIWVPVVVEIASGSRMKYAVDKASGLLALHRAMAPGITYPTSYGFIAHTVGDDGDELDMLILAAEPLLPLTLVRVRPIGGCTLDAEDKGVEDKIVGVALGDPSVAEIGDISEVPAELRLRIEAFFRTFKQDEGVAVEFKGWFGALDAHRRVKAGLKAGRGQ